MPSHKHYKRKAVIAGNYIEHYVHEFPISYGFEGKHGGGRKVATSGKSIRSDEYRKRATNKARYELIRLINENFTGDELSNECYKFITLTFREGAIPDVTDVKQANAEFKRYARKLRGICKRLGMEFNYVNVIEFQDENSRGAVHFHLITNIPAIPVTRDKAEEWIREGRLPPNYNPKDNHYDLWGLGAVTIKAIRVSDQDNQSDSTIEAKNMGEFVTGYMVKDLGDSRLRGVKAYSPSQGLTKPRVLYNEEADKACEGLEKENVVSANSYIDTYHHTPVYYTKLQTPKN